MNRIKVWMSSGILILGCSLPALAQESFPQESLEQESALPATTNPTLHLEIDSGNGMIRGVGNFAVGGRTATLFLGDTNNFIQAKNGFGVSISTFQAPQAFNILNGTLSGQVAVGIGTASPDSTLTVNGSADKPGGGSWGVFSDRRLKTLSGDFSSGLEQILKLKPVRYRYKADNALGIRDHEEHVGLVAQDVQRLIPEAVTANSKGYLLINNDPILWAMLNAIKQQQMLIDEQQNQIKLQHAQIGRLARQVKTVQASLQASGQADSDVRTAEVQKIALH